MSVVRVLLLYGRPSQTDLHDNSFLRLIQPKPQGVAADMSLTVSIPALTCQNGKKARLNRVLSTPHHGVRMKQTGKSKTVTELSPAECADLLARVGRRRDIEAFETLFRHYGPRVRAFMAMKTRDMQMAEELMQETMAAVWNKAVQFDPERGQASAWIFTIARNLRIDAFRRKRPVFDESDPAFVQDDAPAADLQLEAQQEADLLREAMESLPAEQLDVLKRAFFDEASHSAIAEDMGLPLGTVKSRIRLAFDKLRTTLEGKR